ncbi:methylmalonyl-CoA mutase family protein [Chryseolinea lacunae]|uniref:Methylmalonyl-CoA mutase alpha/beta chain catalytic domain-containing protein n=1 Tax=Chryseolinea lacunae TaxID=2801331 RepID=A0ABS1KKT1_9BACT|nr:methylmalonyl-CoA mutase family protein [Chryseolinea lacunae]MBL0740066.1 hypothetical protein [Chryseolinea lacunae]
MSESPLHNLLQQSFSKTNKADWLKAAAAEIEGKNPEEALAWNSAGLSFLPYYDRHDTAALTYLQQFEIQPSQHPHSNARYWENVPRVTVTDEKKANSTILHHLNHGADGILLDVQNRPTVDFAGLLENIDWPYCSVSFLATHNTPIDNGITAFLDKKNFAANTLTGTVWWTHLPEKNIPKLDVLSHLNHFHRWGIIEPSSTAVDEVAGALTKAARLMDALTEEGIEKEIAWKNIALSLPVGTDFYASIAKLKALRLLWSSLAQAFHIVPSADTALHLHVRSEVWINEKFQPHGNLLKSTTAAMAAVMGGCDALTVDAEVEEHTMMMRMARNVSTILREESHLDKVADPLAGAYAVNQLTHTIAQAAWQSLQQNLQHG